MGKAREIKRRIKSVSSTEKITRTMEMVATARSKQAQDRLKTLKPYTRDLSEMAAGLLGSASHPLLKEPEETKRVVHIILSSNRGLCGAYNTNILHLARDAYQRDRAAGIDVEVHASGKKAIGYHNRVKIPMAESYTHLEDRPTFEDAEAIAGPLMERFIAGEIQRATVIFCRYHSAGDQRPGEMQLIPFVHEQKDESQQTQHIFEPDPTSILADLLPMSVSMAMLGALAESAACEQIARRVAMKLASDNAEELLKFLTRTYNRARQSQITQELSEIMGGAEALK